MTDACAGSSRRSPSRSRRARAADVGSEREEIGARRPNQVQVWRLDDPDLSPLDEARRLRDVTGRVKLVDRDGRSYELPSVTPNHAAIVSGTRGSGCPAGPPREARRPTAFVHRALPGWARTPSRRIGHGLHLRRPAARAPRRAGHVGARRMARHLGRSRGLANKSAGCDHDRRRRSADRDRRARDVHRRVGRARLPAGRNHRRRSSRQRGSRRQRRQPISPVGLRAVARELAVELPRGGHDPVRVRFPDAGRRAVVAVRDHDAGGGGGATGDRGRRHPPATRSRRVVTGRRHCPT